MHCQHCGEHAHSNWEYCPKCGVSLRGKGFNFGDLFNRVRKEMEVAMSRTDEDFARDIEAVDLTPFFKKKHGSGFTVKIVSGSGMEPKVEVNTFGDVNKNELEKQVEKQLGVQHKEPQQPKRRLFSRTKTTEEPRAEVRNLGDRVVVELEVPGVKDEKDIDIVEHEASVEVRAVAGKKAYFKILTKPEESSLQKKHLEKDKLVLEFA